MIPASVLDHSAKVFRYTESRGSTMRETRRSWKPVLGMDDYRLKLSPLNERLADTGAGERAAGEWKAIAGVGDVEEGDVLDVVTGPEAPVYLEVLSKRSPGGRHLELELAPWTGSLS